MAFLNDIDNAELWVRHGDTSYKKKFWPEDRRKDSRWCSTVTT